MHSVRVSMLERSIMKTTLLPCLFLGALFVSDLHVDGHFSSLTGVQNGYPVSSS